MGHSRMHATKNNYRLMLHLNKASVVGVAKVGLGVETVERSESCECLSGKQGRIHRCQFAGGWARAVIIKHAFRQEQ